MPTALTTEQRTAIETRDVSVALSAGAGCGKTFVLTERFLSHLDRANADDRQPPRLSQLIAITFTDAAAREMRSRIRRACWDRFNSAKTSDEQNHWLGLLREIDSARVSTIHAFCASLLRSHATEADLDPTFGVLDQVGADVLQYEVIDDVLRDRLSELDPDTLNLAAAYGLGQLKQQIAALLGRRHDPCFDKWSAASADEVVAAWREWYDVNAFPNALRQIADAAPMDEILKMLGDCTPRSDNHKFIDARAQLVDLLPSFATGSLTESDLDTIGQCARVQTICTAKDWPSKDAYDGYKDACAELRACLEKHQPAEWNSEVARETAELGLALLRLTAAVASDYNDRKRADNSLDFDDLLSATNRVLSDPQNAAMCQELADDLRLLLVDEFQDTDQLQVDLVRKLCGAGFDTGRLFFVGDFKQSIYRFRGAEPDVFRKLRADVKKKGQLPLTKNFRSQPAILTFVNALFHDTFRGEGQGYEALRPDREQITDPKSVEFLWTITPDKNNKRIVGAALEARREEAKAIARRLSSLIDETSTELPIVDKNTGKPRRLQLADVAILFRTLGDVQVYEESLRSYNLNYYLVGGHAFYSQQEIYDVLNLLRAVASTADEVSLAGVLRSPFFSLADETLFWLVDAAGSLNAGLAAATQPAELAVDEKAKVTAAAETIRHLRAMKDRVPIARLLGEALDRTGYDAVLLTEFLGERKLANLHKLIEQARAADHGGATDLDGFITQLDQFTAQDPKEALAATLPETANVIRLMTIHHAKGLEFPLVIVPDLDRQPRHDSPSAALHPDLGPLVPRVSDDDGEKAAVGMSLFAAMERVEELEERKRMLYVAFTRARDYLILSSSIESCEALRSDWMKLVADRFNLETGELNAALPTDYDVPQVRIVTDPKSAQAPAGKSRGPDLIAVLDSAHGLAADRASALPPEVAPVLVDRAARRQFSFSRLTGKLVRRDRPWEEPGNGAAANVPPTVLAGRGFGSLVHDILARIDFSAPGEIAAWCEHLAPLYVVTDANRAADEARKLIEKFVASPRGRQLAAAKSLHHEVEFLLAWPPRDSAAAVDGLHLHGYIDALYQDASGAWRIADYKTNNIPAADAAKEAAQYEMQMYVYAMAAERALGHAPAELVLHFLRPGVEHIFPWNDAARRRAIQMVNDAINAPAPSP